jgi:hypothetical protein
MDDSEYVPTTTQRELLDSVKEALESKEVIRLFPSKLQRKAIAQILQQRLAYRYTSKDNKEHSMYAVLREIHLLSKLFDEVLHAVGWTLGCNIRARALAKRATGENFIYTI